MAEFKKLSEVELLETASDNATVLVEEGGEIKRVAKSEVGGAGGYLMPITADNFDGTYCTENYDEMYDILMAGGNAWLDLSAMYATNVSTFVSAGPSFSTITDGKVLIINWALTDLGLVCDALGNSYVMNGEMLAVIFPNGSHNPEGSK